MPGYMTNNKSFTSRMKTRTLVELLKVETLGLVHCGHLYLFSMHRALSRESSDGSPSHISLPLGNEYVRDFEYIRAESI